MGFIRFLFFLLAFVGISFSQKKGQYGQIFQLNPVDIKRVFNSGVQTDKVLMLLDNLAIALFPKFKALKAINSIYLHPYFTTTVIFYGYTIKKAETSFKTSEFAYYKNLLEIRVPSTFRAGTIDILLQDDKGHEKFVKLFAFLLNPYSDYPPLYKENFEGKIKPQTKILYAYQVYIDRPILQPYEVLDKYQQMFGSLPEEDTTFCYAGICYKIYANPKYPNVRFGNKSYRVEVNKVNYSPS
jgi:hypothetical protein